MWGLAALGCGERRPSAAEQYQKVLADLRAGSLARAYDGVVPASYDRDLNDVVAGLRKLLAQEDFAALRDLVATAGKSLSEAVVSLPMDAPLREHAARAAERLPEIFGLEEESSFRRLSIRDHLERIDRGFFAEIARQESVRARLEGLEVSLLETKGDWAKLRFRSLDAEGVPTDEEHEVILVDGVWVFNAWAAQWDDQVASWKRAVLDLAELKRQDPGVIRERLRTLEDQLSEIPRLLGPMLESLGIAGSSGP